MTSVQDMAKSIKQLIDEARLELLQEAASKLLTTYWRVGEYIVEQEQSGENKAKYGARLLVELAKELRRSGERGFSRSNLQDMRRFYLTYNLPDVSGKLSWSHYISLLSIEDDKERSFYEKEALNANWSVRDLKRQLDTQLYQRLLLSNGEVNKNKILTLAAEGISMQQPTDILRDPFVFEFIGVEENKPILEKELEEKLIRQLEAFMLELGRGFMFVGSHTESPSTILITTLIWCFTIRFSKRMF